MTQAGKYDQDFAALFVQSFGEAVRAAQNLRVSLRLFRGLLRLEEETTESMLDVLNAMEKRGIIVSFDDWKMLRGLRNTFMYDYPGQSELRAEALTRAHAKASELCQVLTRIRERATGRIGLPASELPEVPP